MRMSAAFSLLAATFVTAAEAQPPAVPAPGHDPDASTRKICRVSPANGSRLGGTRTCRTREEWAQAQREARMSAERIQRGTAACMMGPNDPRLGAGPHLVCGN
jgi:hypothetical protein